jgi:endonuclease YncB( thermonuclease family)
MQLRRALSILAGIALVFPLLSGCQGSKRVRRLRKAEVQKRLLKLETPGLLIGEFPLARNAVVDGDTVKVAGLDTSMRLLGIDTEETFKSEEDRRLYEQGFEKYLQVKRGDSPKPVKVATPLGEEAKHFAEKFFEGVGTARLERDHPKDIRGRYNRYLAYVFVKRGGEWVNYNVECVRAGMSPYFTKYAYSRRFHDQFVQAQKEAREKGLGIWDPRKEHYRDYDERIRWWNARADFIKKFEEEARGRDNYVVLTHWDSLRRLEQHEGKPVEVLATVGGIKIGDKGPTKVMLGRRLLGDFPLIFFDRDVFGSSNISRWEGEFIRVSGTVTRYRNKHTNKDELQIVVSLPGQIEGSELVPNYSGWDGETEAEQAELDEEQRMREHLYQEVE